jgi:hypothetical protein
MYWGKQRKISLYSGPGVRKSLYLQPVSSSITILNLWDIFIAGPFSRTSDLRAIICLLHDKLDFCVFHLDIIPSSVLPARYAFLTSAPCWFDSICFLRRYFWRGVCENDMHGQPMNPQLYNLNVPVPSFLFPYLFSHSLGSCSLMCS